MRMGSALLELGCFFIVSECVCEQTHKHAYSYITHSARLRCTLTLLPSSLHKYFLAFLSPFDPNRCGTHGGDDVTGVRCI